MFMLHPTGTADVGFAAGSMHVDKSGTVWARLMNGKLASYNPATNMKEISNFRTWGVAWSEDQALLIDKTFQLTSYGLASKQVGVKTRVQGGTGPICLGATGRIFVCCAEEVWEVFSDGSISRLFCVDYEIMSMAVCRHVIWVGGYGLDRFDLKSRDLHNLESGRDLPILEIAGSSERDLVATAGDALCLYDREGELLSCFGNSLFRCQFSNSNILFTCKQAGKTALPLEWNSSQEFGLHVCTFTDCAEFHCYGAVGNEKVIVSYDGKLLFYDLHVGT